MMKVAYNKKIIEFVLPAFKKFDTDESGAIEKKELQQLCEYLGCPLTDEEADIALIDLDLDKSGDIDFHEFKRWYFTGMKSYSATDRKMMEISSSSMKYLDSLEGHAIFDFVNVG